HCEIAVHEFGETVSVDPGGPARREAGSPRTGRIDHAGAPFRVVEQIHDGNRHLGGVGSCGDSPRHTVLDDVPYSTYRWCNDRAPGHLRLDEHSRDTFVVTRE